MSYDSGYNTASHGGYGNVGGGGFVSNGYGGADNSNSKSSPSNTGERTVSEGKSRLRPVTIKQILSATQSQEHPDAETTIDGAEASTVTFVAIVRNILNQSTNSTYRVEDGTGALEVKKFLAAAEENTNSDLPQIGQYIRVIGDMKTFNDKRYIQVNLMRPITDYNEVIYAQLDALSLHLQTLHPQKIGRSTKNTTNDAASAGLETSTRSYANEDLTSLQRRILDTLKNAEEQNSNEGIHLHIIAQRCGITVDTAQASCEKLSESGLIYTTIDYEHFKLT